VVINLPPSRAGNGRRLITQRLIERSAIIIQITCTPALFSTSATNVCPTPIGHESIFFASSLSSGVVGAISPWSISERNTRVITLPL